MPIRIGVAAVGIGTVEAAIGAAGVIGVEAVTGTVAEGIGAGAVIGVEVTRSIIRTIRIGTTRIIRIIGDTRIRLIMERILLLSTR